MIKAVYKYHCIRPEDGLNYILSPYFVDQRRGSSLNIVAVWYIKKYVANPAPEPSLFTEVAWWNYKDFFKLK